MKIFACLSLITSTCLLVTAVAAERPATANPGKAGDGVQVGVGKQDGVTIAGDEVYITRNGATEKLVKELVLPSGVIARPDGTLVLPDKTSTRLRATQLLTFEGTIVELPRETVSPATQTAIVTSVPATQTTVQTTTTTTTNTAGTISEFSPDTLVIRSETSPEPLRYRYSKTTTYVDETGAPVTLETVKSGLPVTVYYTNVGGQLVANRVVVRKTATTATIPGAPVVEKKTTTTVTKE